MGELTKAYMNAIRERVAHLSDDPPLPDLYELLHVVSRWRSEVQAQTQIALNGQTVVGGPFAGMEYATAASEGGLMARLLGCYEAELQPHLERFGQEHLDCVIDIGCSDGYYAIGLARAWPQATVYAYDTNETARLTCARLADRNGVADRVVVGGEFQPDGFEAFAGRRALVIVDIEGAEVDLLHPSRSPALAQMNLIVETHDSAVPGAFETIRSRFEPTHDLQRVDIGTRLVDLPPWVNKLSHLDQLLAVWEWRGVPTPWLVMTPRA